MRRPKKKSHPADPRSYQHPTADSPMRPDVGTQAQFKKRKPPQTCRYDSSSRRAGPSAARASGTAAITATPPTATPTQRGGPCGWGEASARPRWFRPYSLNKP